MCVHAVHQCIYKYNSVYSLPLIQCCDFGCLLLIQILLQVLQCIPQKAGYLCLFCRWVVYLDLGVILKERR